MNPFENFFQHYTSQPVPPTLMKLFSITEKKELRNFARSASISKVELVALTHTCHKIGYQHFIEYGNWIPAHLKATLEENEAFQRARVGHLTETAAKFVAKISNTFTERKYRVGHLFVGNQRWHLLFLELSDIREHGNHWEVGPHIHFTNDLCSPLGIDEVSRKFTALDFKMGQRHHIKWLNSR